MEIKIVNNSLEYWENIRNLRNNPKVKSGFIQQAEIRKAEHINYMYENGSNFIVAINEYGEFLGYAGVLEDDIRVCVEPKWQKQGVGRKLIESLIERWPDAIAKVKITNTASFNLFKSMGFRPVFYLMQKEPKQPLDWNEYTNYDRAQVKELGNASRN